MTAILLKMLILRYTNIHQRTARHDLFSTTKTTETPAQEEESQVKKYSLKPVKFLLGTVERLDNVIVLGMLTQVNQIFFIGRN